MDLLLLIDNEKSHYVYIKDFNRFMFDRTNNKNKKWFLWYHVRYTNPSNKFPERIKKPDKNIAEKRNEDGIEFPV